MLMASILTIPSVANCSISANTEYGVHATVKATIMMNTIVVARASALLTRPSRCEFCTGQKEFVVAVE